MSALRISRGLLIANKKSMAVPIAEATARGYGLERKQPVSISIPAPCSPAVAADSGQCLGLQPGPAWQGLSAESRAAASSNSGCGAHWLVEPAGQASSNLLPGNNVDTFRRD